VTRLYADLLGRPVETTVLNNNVALLSSGRFSAQQEVTRIITDSRGEFNHRVSQAIYSQLFLNPNNFTAADVNSGAAFLASRGGSVERLIQQILVSDAFYRDSGGTNTGYVNSLYQVILGRSRNTAGNEGQGFITALNNGASRQSVVQQFVSSTEGTNSITAGLAASVVDEIYLTLLHRPSTNDPGALAYVRALQQGRANDQQVITAIATSKEYVASTGGQVIPLSKAVGIGTIVNPNTDAANRNFVTSLYTHLLLRTPEASALTFYANQLDAAHTNAQINQARVRVVTEIVNSTEFRQTTINRVVQTLLGRPATQAELNNTASFENQAVAFLSSDTFYNSPQGGGGTNQGYLNSLYTIILGRTGTNPAGSDPGSAVWLNELNNGVARSTVVKQLVSSPEGSAHVSSSLVNLVYVQLLGRTAVGDPGATPWINSLGRTLTVKQLVINVASSQ
jgi:hypothetical protein